MSEKIYQSTYLAFLDILGFKNIVKAHSHEHLESVYQRFCDVIEHGLSNEKYVLIDSEETKSIGPDIRQATVNSLLVSDSIIIWTNDNSAESFNDIVKAVKSLLAFSIVDRIPLRGAISVGPLTVVLKQWPLQTHNFQHTLFGKALAEAAEAERTQEWCGCEITKTAIEQFKSKCNDWEAFLEKRLIVAYPIPRKNGAKEDAGYVIDWVNHPQTEVSEQTVIGAFEASTNPNPEALKKFKEEEWEKVKRKITNTLKFLKTVKS